MYTEDDRKKIFTSKFVQQILSIVFTMRDYSEYDAQDLASKLTAYYLDLEEPKKIDNKKIIGKE